jgi:hypothetical protein
LLTEDETLVDAAGVTVPAELLEPGTDHRFEVLAVADNANRTIHEGTFSAIRGEPDTNPGSDRY